MTFADYASCSDIFTIEHDTIIAQLEYNRIDDRIDCRTGHERDYDHHLGRRRDTDRHQHAPACTAIQ